MFYRNRRTDTYLYIIFDLSIVYFQGEISKFSVTKCFFGEKCRINASCFIIEQHYCFVWFLKGVVTTVFGERGAQTHIHEATVAQVKIRVVG